MKVVKRKKVVVAAVTMLALLAFAACAFALNATGSTVGSGVWTLINNDLLHGPIGAAAGVGLIVTGAVMAVMGKLSAAVWPLIGGGLMGMADTIVNSLGKIF